MTGIELAARLLALRPALRIVMMTGDPARAEAARGHPSIVDEVLLKPMRIEELDRGRPAGRGRDACRVIADGRVGAPAVTRASDEARTRRRAVIGWSPDGWHPTAARRTAGAGHPRLPRDGSPRPAWPTSGFFAAAGVVWILVALVRDDPRSADRPDGRVRRRRC